MTDAIIERCAGDMDRARCDGLKPAYYEMGAEVAASACPVELVFLGLRVIVRDDMPPNFIRLVATGTPDTPQSLLAEAGELISQCAETDAVEEKLYMALMDWLRRYNKQKEG